MEIEREKALEAWPKRCTRNFTKKVKRMLFEEIDNMAWRGDEKVVSQWCQKNKVYDEITEKEIEEIWNREGPDEEPIRLNEKRSGRRQREYATTLTHTKTSLPSQHSVSTEW